MKFEYSLTPQDYRAAFKLHRRQKLSRRIVPWIGPLILLTAVITFVVSSLYKNLELAAQSLAWAAGAVVFSIGIPVSRYINLRKSYTRLFPPGHRDRTSLIEIDDQGIRRSLSGTSELNLLWGEVYDFIQDNNVCMIYTNKDCFLILPTKIMSREDRTSLNEIVTRHLVRKL